MEETLSVSLPVSELRLVLDDVYESQQVARMDGEDELADQYEHVYAVIAEALAATE